MKKLLLSLIFLLFCMPAISQGWVFINGTVTSSEAGYPVPFHAVTIMSDSTNGFFYYNVVNTDSTGYYYDDIPVLSDSTGTLYVQILDCNDIMYQAVIYYNPVNNTYMQDFQICTSSVSCQAQFDYYPEPQGSPDSFQFTDLSTGNIVAWSWDFGDGTSSVEQNPFHSYPGPGTYDVCLSITGNNCADTYCQTIAISDTVYQQFYGQVFAGDFPLQAGMVMLFTLNQNGTYSNYGDGVSVDSNGVYFFTLVPEGIYLIQAVPFDSNGYLPTYYGDVINWQQATQVVVGVPNNLNNINMVAVPAGMMAYGPGSVSGQINSGQMERSVIDKINMMLLNESFLTIGFSHVNSSGQFDFPSMAYGTYYLYAELSGVASYNIKIEITPEKPHVEVVLNFSGNSILGLEDTSPAEKVLSIFPNPVVYQLNILYNLKLPARINIEIYTITGQLVYKALESGNAGQNTFTIPFNDFSGGLFTLRIYSADGINIVRKVIK